MTIEEVVSQANRGDIASRDIDLLSVLKNKVIHDFFLGVGEVAWRRRHYTFTLSTTTRNYPQPADFMKLIEVYLLTTPALVSPNQRQKPLRNITEDPLAIALANANTAAGKPAAYYLKQDEDPTNGTGKWNTIRFDRDADQPYTASSSYVLYPYNIGQTEDLSRWIPDQFHWGLVEGLRAEIFGDRYGIGDDRYERCQQEFLRWQAKAAEHGELSRKSFVVSVR